MRVPPEAVIRPRPRGRTIVLAVLFGVLAFGLIAIQGLAGFYTNFLWFHWNGVGDVWSTVTTTKIAIAATFIPGCFVSIPNSAWPLTLSGVSNRLAGVPIRVKSFGSFSTKLSGVGTGRAAAASPNCP